MQTLAFDGRMGASGDMIVGALLAVGADRDLLTRVEHALAVEYDVGATTKNGIRSTRVVVGRTATEHDAGDDHSHDHAPDHDHEHEHDHDHEHANDHVHEHEHAEGGGPLRTYPEVIEIVESMELPSSVEATATAIFRRLGEAEASVHGTSLEATHFHEVGADDAIADIVGAALLFDDLGVERVVTTPLSTGGGEVSMSHGTYPVPTPAVATIAEQADWALCGGPVDSELLTPTGAAILAEVADGVETLPTLDIERSGYGAGSHEFLEHPNVLRALVGRSRGRLIRDDIRVLETNLDDATPELLGGLQESLSDAGARDVSILPATMKKSRPGHLVKVITKPEDAERVARRLAEETGTLGVRETGVDHRFIADRSFETATVEIEGTTYDVSVKIARDSDGVVYDVSAEYDDAAAVASETGHPTRDVLRRAEDAIETDRTAR